MDPLPELIQLITSTGFISVTCIRTYDPPRVEIDTAGGFQIVINYDQYEQIRQAAGLPDDVCRPDNTFG